MYHTKLGTAFYSKVIGQVTISYFNDIIEDLVKSVHSNAPKFLEVGCGPGDQVIKLHSNFRDVQFVALDYSDQQLAVAREKKKSLDPNDDHENNLEFVQGDAMNLAFEDNHFDGLYSIGAIKHFSDPVKALKEFLRVVKPGGKIVVAEFLHEATEDDYFAMSQRSKKFNVKSKRHVLHKFLMRMIMNKSYKINPKTEEIEKEWKEKLTGFESYEVIRNVKNSPFFCLTITKQK